MSRRRWRGRCRCRLMCWGFRRSWIWWRPRGIWRFPWRPSVGGCRRMPSGRGSRSGCSSWPRGCSCAKRVSLRTWDALFCRVADAGADRVHRDAGDAHAGVVEAGQRRLPRAMICRRRWRTAPNAMDVRWREFACRMRPTRCCTCRRITAVPHHRRWPADRRLYPVRDDATPFYVQEQGAYVGCSKQRVTVKKSGRSWPAFGCRT